MKINIMTLSALAAVVLSGSAYAQQIATLDVTGRSVPLPVTLP